MNMYILAYMWNPTLEHLLIIECKQINNIDTKLFTSNKSNDTTTLWYEKVMYISKTIAYWDIKRRSISSASIRSTNGKASMPDNPGWIPQSNWNK